MSTGIQLVNGLPKAITIMADSAGDITETSFAGANNQSTPANVTGLSFSNGTVRAFSALVSVALIATASKYTTFTLSGVQKGSDWDLNSSYVGDDCGVVFTITSAGQVQYVSNNSSGFTSLTIKFRALTSGA